MENITVSLLSKVMCLPVVPEAPTNSELGTFSLSGGFHCSTIDFPGACKAILCHPFMTLALRKEN